jgi:hypothetical protein
MAAMAEGGKAMMAMEKKSLEEKMHDERRRGRTGQPGQKRLTSLEARGRRGRRKRKARPQQQQQHREGMGSSRVGSDVYHRCIVIAIIAIIAIIILLFPVWLPFFGGAVSVLCCTYAVCCPLPAARCPPPVQVVVGSAWLGSTCLACAELQFAAVVLAFCSILPRLASDMGRA